MVLADLVWSIGFVGCVALAVVFSEPPRDAFTRFLIGYYLFLSSLYATLLLTPNF